MKIFYYLTICSFAILVPAAQVSSQTIARYTTAELLKKAKDFGFHGNDPSQELNIAIPLIDSITALSLTKISDGGINNFFNYAISLQCRDESLKQMIVSYLLGYDKLCANTMIEKNDYNAGTYEYGKIRNALLAQIEKSDSNLLSLATHEFEFWAPFAYEYTSVVLKPGIGQLSMGKRKFDPCVLAAPSNCGLWISCIYSLTGKESYDSPDEKQNKVYKKLKSELHIERRTDKRKDFIRLGKEEIVKTSANINSLDSVDFETIPELKEKFDKIKKNNNYQIVIYTNKNKGLLYTVYTDKGVGFSKQEVSITSLQLVEIQDANTIRFTKVGFRDRYLF